MKKCIELVISKNQCLLSPFLVQSKVSN